MTKNEERVDIINLIPKNSEFSLSQFKNEKFKLVPCTGYKLMEISQSLGKVEDLLSYPTAENISKLAMSLMDYKSASKFKKQNVKKIDVLTGEESTESIGGYRLLMSCISSISEQYDIYGAILVSLGYGNSKVKEMVDSLKNGVSEISSGKNNVKKKKVNKKKARKKS